MNKALYSIVALIAGLLGWFIFTIANDKPLPEHALFYQQERVVKPFVMTDHLGRAFSHEQLKNKWSWIFLGYTSCPDVCPTTLQELNYVYDELLAIDARSQVLFISVDPKRDSTEKLADYIKYFNPAFIALNADHGVLFPFARNMGLMYAINDDDTHGMYTVDHSSAMILINPRGNIAAIFQAEQVLGKPPTVTGDNLVSDFAKVVALYH